MTNVFFADTPLPLLFGGGGLVLLAALVGGNALMEKRRTSAESAIAKTLGMTFTGKAWSDPSQSADLVTALFQPGILHEFTNIMSGTASGLSIAIFDYSYVISEGKITAKHVQTVATFQKAGVALTDGRALDQTKTWTLESSGKTLIVYRDGKRAPVNELRDFRDQTAAIASQFFARTAS